MMYNILVNEDIEKSSFTGGCYFNDGEFLAD